MTRTLLGQQAAQIYSPNKIGIAEFAESSDFCGKPLYPLQRVLLKLIFLEDMEGWEEDILSWWIQGGRNNEVLLSPNIRERRDWCRDKGYDHFAEIDLVGGRRSAKGYVTGLAGGYKLWKTRQISDPASFFNMDIDKQIEFACIAAAFDQAKTRQFADFYSVINRCKALQPYISKRQEEVITIRADSDIALVKEMTGQGIKIAKDFSKFRVLPLAANADTLRGSASIMIVFDEMAFMMPGESRSSAQECYVAAEPSLAQFGKHAMVFCNPPEAPIWMADLTHRPIGEVQVGDQVVGWMKPEHKTHRELCSSTVTNVMRRWSSIVKVTMASGRTFRCTPDHHWLTTSSGGNKETHGGEWYAPAKIGRKLVHVVDSAPLLDPAESVEDFVVSIEPDGEGEVIALTTTTGNYVANGYASKNCNSSPYSRIGQFYEQYELAMRKPDHGDGWYPMRFAMEFPSWALFDKWWLDSPIGKRAKYTNAIMVSPDWPDQLEPEVEESKLDEKNLTMRAAEKLKERASPDTYKVEYRGNWAEVLDAYLDPARVDAAYNGKKPDGKPCLRTRGGNYLHTYMGHCDPSSTTAGFGFALGHIEEFKDESGFFPDGIARHVIFDLVKRWNPQNFPGEVINYIKVREELTHFANIYRPVAITFDQYNSAGLIQELRAETRKLNIQNLRISEVTATQKVNWNRWEAFKTALYLGLVHIPPDCVEMERYGEFDYSDYSKQELKFLQEVQAGQTKRVEKQDLGPIQTKDIADCIAEVTLKFLGSYIGDFMDRQFANSKLSHGAEGGYPIGGRQPGGPMGGQKPTKSNRFEEFYSGRGSRHGQKAARGIDARRRGRR